jgi:hypothetical protein
MANVLNAPTNWASQSTQTNGNISNSNIWNKWMAFSDTQAKNQTLWFLISLIFQGVLFLPIPAALMFYYNAPIIVLIITMVLFFANIIAGMGGSGIRVTLLFFAVSIIVHLLMLAVFLL